MARTAKLTASLPKLAVEPELRRRVQEAADEAEVAMADVVRDCIIAALPTIELQLGLVDIEELSEEDLAAMGLERQAPPAPTSRAAGCFGGPPLVG